MKHAAAFLAKVRALARKFIPASPVRLLPMATRSWPGRPGNDWIVIGLLVAGVTAESARAVDLVWTNLAGGNWNAATNWSPNQVPGPADHAQIVAAGSYTVTLNTNASVGQLTLGDGSGTPTLIVPGTPTVRQLTVTNGLTVRAGAVLRQGGMLSGDLVRVEGRCDWIGGTLSGLSTNILLLEIENGGRLNLTNNVTRTLRNATITNRGTNRWTVGTLTATAGTNALQNAGTFDFDFAADAAWTVSGAGTTARIENLAGGVLHKSGAGDVTLNAVFANDGAIQIDGGSVVFAKGGTNRAQLTIGAAATLQFSGGPVDLEAGALSGTGTNLISGAATVVRWRPGVALAFPGTLFLDGGALELGSGLPATLGALWLDGGTLRGGDTVDVSGAVTWVASTLDGLEINARGTLDFAGTATRSFNSGIVRNHNAATWSGGLLQKAGVAADAVFENTGTLELNGGGSWNNPSGGPARLINRGVLRKSAGAGTTLGFRFEQPSGGRLEVTNGSVTLHGGGFSAGVFETAANGTNRVDSGDFELQTGAEVRGDGLLRISSNTFDIQSGVVSAANHGILEIAGNVSLRLTSGLVFATDGLNLVSGFLEGPGRLAVAGHTDWRATGLRNGIFLDCLGGLTMTNSPISSRGFSEATLRNAGSARWTTGQLGSSAPSLITNAPGGTFEVGDGMRWIVSGVGSSLLANDGDFVRLAGNGVTHLDGNFINRGTTELRGVLELKSNSGTYTQSAGRTILTNGTLRTDPPVAINGGTVEGNGTIDASLANSGTLKPGASPGQIHVTGNVVQSTAGAIEVELAGTAAGQFDVLQVDGRALLGGIVRALPMGGVTPQPGDTFPFLTAAGGRTGVFEHLDAASGPPWFEVLEQANGAALRVLTGPPVLTITLDVAPTVTISAEQRLEVPVTVSFPGGDVDVVVLSAQFGDPTLVPPANVSFVGTGRARAMKLRPDLLRSGTTRVTVNALGAAGATTNGGFTLEITPAPPQGLLAWEPFDYSPANVSLNTKNGGVGFATPWFAPATALNARVTANSLPYPSLRTAGAGAQAPVLSASIGSLSRRLSSALGTPGTTRYLSFLARPDGTVGEGAFNGFFGLLLDTAVAPDLFLGKPGGGVTNHWVIEDAGSAFQQPSAIAVSSGQVAWLVARFDFENGNDRVSLFVNPVPGQPEPTSPDAVRADRDLGNFQDLALNSTGAWSVDELRVGTTWESITPDLNQIALLGLRPIPDQAAQEGAFFSYAVQLQELVTPREPHFELINNPAGMQINDTNGLISWSPPEDAGGQTYVVTVRVHDLPEPPVRSATTDFTVSVQEANQPPRLAFIPEIQLEPQPPRPFTLQLVALDDDTPTNTFTFALVSGPTGLSVSADGFVTWTPPPDQPPGGTNVHVLLTDFNAGAPPATQRLSQEEVVTLNVQAAGPDPAVTVIAQSEQVAAGAEAAFEVEVLNRGTLPAPDVELRLQLPGLSGTPPRITLLGATSPVGDCVLVGDEVSCALGVLAPDAGVTVDIRLSFSLAGLETLDWQVISPTDLNTANNHAQSAILVVRPVPPTPPNPLEWQVQTATDEGELTAVRIAADPEGLPNLLSQLDTSRARLSIWDGYTWRQSGGGDDPPGGFPIAFRMLGQSREALLAPNPAQVNYFADLGLGVHYPLLFRDGNANPSDWPGYSIVRDALLPGGSVGRDDAAILYRVLHYTDNLLDTWQDRTLARIINQEDGWPLVPPDQALLHPRKQFVLGTVASFGDQEFVAAAAQKRTNGLPPVMQIVYLPSVTPGLDGWEDVQTLCEIPPFDTFAFDELRYPPVAAARDGDRRVAVYSDCNGGVWFAERVGTLWQTEQITGVPAGVIRNLAITLSPDGFPLVGLVMDAPCVSSPCPVDRHWWIAKRTTAWEFTQLDELTDPIGGDPSPAGGTVVPGAAKFSALDGGLDLQFHVVGSDVRLAYNTGYPTHDIKLARLTPRWSQYLNLGVAGPDTFPRLTPGADQSPPHVAWSGALDTVNQGLYIGKFEPLRGGLRFLAQVVEAVGHPANLGIGLADSVVEVLGDSRGLEVHRVYKVAERITSHDVFGFASDQPVGIGIGHDVLGLLPDGRPAISFLDWSHSEPDTARAFPGSLILGTPRDAAAFAVGRSGSLFLRLCLYHIGPPINQLRLAQYELGSDILLTEVDIGSLPHGGRPLLRACATLHAPFDEERNHGFLYAVYPRREGETISLRVGRMNLSAATPVWEEVTLQHTPPLDYGVQSVAIAAERESLKIAFTDETAWLLQADQINNFSRVAEASFEPLPFAPPVRNVDLAANDRETWASYVSGDRVHVAALGIVHRLTSLWDAENAELLAPASTGLGRLCPAETIWIFAGYRPPPEPETPVAPDSVKSPSKQKLRSAVTKHGVDPEPQDLTAASLADPRLDTLRAVRDLMLQTAEGRRLEALYREHSEEVRRLLITNPDLLFASGSILLNLVPSLDGWIQGRGAKARVTASMATQLDSVWMRLTAGAGPELKAALLAERERFHGFSDFAGRDFDEWAARLQFPATATVPQEFRILSTELSGGKFVVTVGTQTGLRFVLQRVPTLASAAWNDTPNFSAVTAGDRVTLTDPDASGGAAFYRVVGLPRSRQGP